MKQFILKTAFTDRSSKNWHGTALALRLDFPCEGLIQSPRSAADFRVVRSAPDFALPAIFRTHFTFTLDFSISLLQYGGCNIKAWRER